MRDWVVELSVSIGSWDRVFTGNVGKPGVLRDQWKTPTILAQGSWEITKEAEKCFALYKYFA